MQQRDLLYTKVTQRGFSPAHVAEVGVWLPETSNIYRFIRDGVRCTLVEPDPKSVRAIRKAFTDQDNITIHPVAILDRKGQIELVRRGPSTYLAGLEVSPALVNDEYQFDQADTFTVEATTFDEIDDGSIELLSIDVEGSEWYVVQGLVSRPAVISAETHGALYTNPRLAEISAWMAANGYDIWYKTLTDTVFVRRGQIRVGLPDRFRLLLTNIALHWRKVRKRAKRRIVALLGRSAPRG